MGLTRNQVCGLAVPWVRIPPLPPFCFARTALRRTGALLSAGAALVGMSVAEPAAAQNRIFTLQELYTLCKATDPQRLSACNGFIAGVRHTLDTFKVSLKDRIGYCIPASVNNRDFKDGFVAWAERNRGEFERAAVRGVIKSAFDRYPCGNAPAKPFEF